MPARTSLLSDADHGPIVVDKFGGSVLRRADDIADAVDAVAEQRASGLRPVVVVSAFEGVTDAILAAASTLLPDRGAFLRGARLEADDSLARETDRALATGEALSAALFALGLQARGLPARSFSGAEAGIRTAAAHLGAEVRRVAPRLLRQALAEGLVPVVAGFQGIGAHGERHRREVRAAATQPGAARSTDSIRASPAARESDCGAGSPGRSSTNVLPKKLPGSLTHSRPCRPRPVSWAIATSQSPSLAWRSSSRSALVDPVRSTMRIRVRRSIPRRGR